MHPRWLADLGTDVMHALRQIRRAPAFAITASLTLALGIGANTAIFSIINGFLRPLPVPNSDRIVVVAAVTPGDETGLRYRFSFPAVQDYRAGASVFSDVFAFDVQFGGLRANGKTTQFVYQAVTGNFFTGLGLQPAAGRLFRPEEGEAPHTDPVIVLGHSYWMRRFGGDAKVIGSIVRLDGRAAQIVGIAPEGFGGTFEGATMDGYVPIGAISTSAGTDQYINSRSIRHLTMVARMRPGVTIDEAQAAANVVAGRLATAYPVTDGGITVRVVPEPLARPVPLPNLTSLVPMIRALMLALASLVLLIACLNVANLLLVRATARAREMAVRVALGSGRARLVRLLLTESLLLAVIGTTAGLLLGSWISTVFAGSLNAGMDVPVTMDFHFDWRVFSYAMAMMIATGWLVGVLPAWRASRAEIADLLHDGGRAGSAGAGSQRARSLLVVAQVAGSVALLVVAGLFVRTLQRAQQMDLGFDPASLLSVRLDLSFVGYDVPRARTFYDDLDRRLRDLPGVDVVATSYSLPLSYVSRGCTFLPEGEVVTEERARPTTGCNTVSPTYFDALRIPVVEGRAFTDRDTAESPRVAIVNQTLAARTWPNANPLGRHFTVPETGDAPWTVIGVARTAKYYAVFEHDLPYLYVPQTQNPSLMRSVTLRSSRPMDELAARVQHEIESLDPDVPIADLQPYTHGIQGNVGFILFRVGAMQSAAMGLLGLALAVVGVYGVVSYRTAQRSREIGIRLALGAEPAHVRTLVLGQGVWLVAAGIAAGLVVALSLTQLMANVLVLVKIADPPTLVAVIALLSVTALVACYIPARRAMRLDPAVVLRHE
jgi:putative ABC transport system permease protein